MIHQQATSSVLDQLEALGVLQDRTRAARALAKLTYSELSVLDGILRSPVIAQPSRGTKKDPAKA